MVRLADHAAEPLHQGKCRACGAAIGVWQPACVLAGAVIGVVAVLLSPE